MKKANPFPVPANFAILVYGAKWLGVASLFVVCRYISGDIWCFFVYFFILFAANFDGG